MEFKNRNRNTRKVASPVRPAPIVKRAPSQPEPKIVKSAEPAKPVVAEVATPEEAPLPIPDKRSRSAIKPKIQVRIRKSKEIKVDPEKIGPIEPTDTPTPRSFRNAIFTTIVVIVVVGGYFLYKSHSQQAGTSSESRSVAVSGPEFKTLIPDGKNIDLLGGWKLVSPPGKTPTYAYNDEINGVKISVSQSILPEKEQADPDKKAAEIAKNFNATKKLQTRYSSVYIGNSAKGPQSLIFIKNKTLVLIKSANTIADESWEKYIDSLNFTNPDKVPQF